MPDRKPQFVARQDNITLHTSQSSTSLSSSFSSSAASSMLAPPSNSSQSDIVAPDHHSAASSPPKAWLTSPAPRSSSLANIMGQSQSRVDQPAASASVLPPPSTSPRAVSKADVAHSTAFKLKRVFGGRRKQSEDVSLALTPLSRLDSKTEGYEFRTQNVAPPRPPLGAKILTTQLLRGRKQSSASPLNLGPPNPPPKPLALHVPPMDKPSNDTQEIHTNQRASILPSSPSIAPALDFMRASERRTDDQDLSSTVPEQGEQKDVWRKSDSTISHHTVRPTAAVGSRTPRPVSMAESFHSAHTIISPTRRLSALIADLEFSMSEEEGPIGDVTITCPNWSQKNSPTSSIRSKRRSFTFTPGPSFYKSPASPPALLPASEREMNPRSPPLSPKSTSDAPTSTRDTPTLTRIAANGIITPSLSNSSPQSTGNQIRGRLAAWTATTHVMVTPPSLPRPLPPLPVTRPRQPSISTNVGAGLRQTAISITGGLAPAAGLAKRAVEKMGRAWGGLTSNSGHSSRNGPSSYANVNRDDGLVRTDSRQSSLASLSNPSSKGKGRRTPNAPSAAWSLASQSSSTLAESEASSANTGPTLGICLRGPIPLADSLIGVTAGIVFGRDLRSCVRNTGVRSDRWTDTSVRSDLKTLESRMLPALVVRSAQHILLWGVQEEGLFRISGRPSHVTKLRATFDTGADYDMSECSPGELDPHAVASVFKAYLRELPEPILTDHLIPYFEAAITAEAKFASSEVTQRTGKGSHGLPSPSTPKAVIRDPLPAIRKPPSLSTLAMPTFTNLLPSESLVNALASLLAQLPQEHRDLMCTVAELIRVTARRSQETKMPLSNLLLVFCPSLHMSPQLLRVLCESEIIWKRAAEGGKPDLGHKQSLPGLESELVPNLESKGASALAADKGDRIGGENTNELAAVLTGREATATVYLDAEEFPELWNQRGSASVPATNSPDARSVEEDDLNTSISEVQSATSPTSASMFTSTDNTSLSSSAESLSTPLSSPQQQYFVDLTVCPDACPSKRQQMSPVPSPIIPDSAPLPLPLAPRNPRLRSVSSFTLSRRRSVPTLNIPNATVHADAPASSASSRGKRVKKPSLNLFSKRQSPSPDSSPDSPVRSPWTPYMQSKPRSETSSSTPISALNAVTAPQSAVSILPPTLDLAIESSELGLDIEQTEDDGGDDESDEKPRGHGMITNLPAESTLSLSLSAVETPIAKRFCGSSPSPSGSPEPIPPPPSTWPMRHHSNASTASFASSYHRLSFEDRQDDWSQSVLTAAHAGGDGHEAVETS